MQNYYILIHRRIRKWLGDNIELTIMTRYVVTTGAGSSHQLEGIDVAMEVDSDTQSSRRDNTRILRQTNSNSIHQQIWRDQVPKFEDLSQKTWNA
jgi:hypothetical protein